MASSFVFLRVWFLCLCVSSVFFYYSIPIPFSKEKERRGGRRCEVREVEEVERILEELGEGKLLLIYDKIIFNYNIKHIKNNNVGKEVPLSRAAEWVGIWTFDMAAGESDHQKSESLLVYKLKTSVHPGPRA